MRPWFYFLMNFLKKSVMFLRLNDDSRDYIMSSESITHHRLSRLSLGSCLLGEPDLISIRQTKVSTNFFKQEKRIEDAQENYINGLIFPTTAHFSSFISTRYKAKDPNKLAVKAKLFMFDVLEHTCRHTEKKIYKFKSISPVVCR